MTKRYFRCEATDPYSRVTLRCIHDRGHDGDHHDAFGDDFRVESLEIADHVNGSESG